MYKSMLDIFNQSQMKILRGKMWWVADFHKPYLVKFASDGEYALIELTDLRSLWIARIDNKSLEQDKERYAKTLDVTQNKGLMNLFETLLTTTDPDPLTIYTFKEIQPAEMHFTFKKRIKFFDFNWTFKLKKVNCNPIELICKQLLTPLSSALKAQTNRLQQLKKRFEQIEKEYVQKLTQMQKSLYKSPLMEDNEQWQQYIPKYEQRLVFIHSHDKFTQFSFENFSQIQNIVKEEHSPLKSVQKMQFLPNRPKRQENFSYADEYYNEELQRSTMKPKKDKKIDFI